MSEVAARLRVAAVGTGYFSQFHHEAWVRMTDVDLVAVCSRSPEKARQAADSYGVALAFSDFETMLDEVKPDLVDIITPPVTHAAYIRAAAARGLPVICQKPFCQTLAEAEEAVAYAEAQGTPLVVHENFRFQPWHREAKAVIDSGRLGDIYQVSFRLRPGDGQGPDAYLARQPYFQGMERFLVHETAIHLVDVFRYLIGDVTNVYAQLVRLNPVIKGEDAGVVLFDFAAGGRGVFDGNRLADHIAENRRLTMGEMVIEGSAGELRLDGDGRLFVRPHGSNGEQALNYDWHDTGFAGDCVYALQRHVVAHLRGQGGLENSGRDYLENLRIEAAIYRSNEVGARVAIDMATAR